MSIMMDIIFASFLGGIITFITLNANIIVKEAWATYNSEVMVQQMLISTAQMVEIELRNMGCGVPNDGTQQVITEARDTCISFLMALRPEPQSSPIVIKYYSGHVNEIPDTENPNDRFLYRQEAGKAPQRIGLITQFTLRYMGEFGELLPTPVTAQSDRINIKIIEITMEVQAPFAAFLDPEDPEKRYASALWKQTRLASQNLERGQ